MINSYPSCALIIGWIVTPWKCESPAVRPTAWRISSKASATWRRSSKLSLTPPTSVLWVSVREKSLTTTGYPIWSAASTAACDVAAVIVLVTGIPYAERICFGLKFIQQRAAGVSGGGDDLRGGRTIDIGITVGERRRFVQRPKVVRISPHVCEGARGLVGEIKCGNTSAVKDRLARRYFGSPHPTGQYGLAVELGQGFDRFGGLSWIGHILRGQNDQHAIVV